MKRLVLALVSALLLAVFIAFNYLLWEREGREEKLRQLENNYANSNASLNTLNREIKSLEDQNSKLESDLNEVKGLNISLQDEVQRLKDDKTAALSDAAAGRELVDTLKKLAGTETFEGMMKKWVDSIETKEYEEAYKLEYGWIPASDRKMTLSAYSAQYTDALKNLKLKSVKVDTEPETSISGTVSLIVVLDVKLADGARPETLPLVDGENTKRVNLKFLNAKDGFAIESISDVQ